MVLLAASETMAVKQPFRIVRRAEEMFLHDQLMETNDCNNEDFHDSAPSGKFGTMTYLVRSSTEMLEREQYSLPQSCIIQ